MINLARNMGGSIGIAGLETILARRTQFHQNSLAAHTSGLDRPFQFSFDAIMHGFTQAGYDVATATQMAYAQMYQMMQGQAAWLAYIDTMWIYAALCLIVVPLPFLMRRPRKGAAPAPAGH